MCNQLQLSYVLYTCEFIHIVWEFEPMLMISVKWMKLRIRGMKFWGTQGDSTKIKLRVSEIKHCDSLLSNPRTMLGDVCDEDDTIMAIIPANSATIPDICTIQ
jgi:hypothetical protein